MLSSHCLLVLAKGAAAFSSPVSIYLCTNNSVMTMGGNNLAVKTGKKLLLIESKKCRCLDWLAWLQPVCFPPSLFCKVLEFPTVNRGICCKDTLSLPTLCNLHILSVQVKAKKKKHIRNLHIHTMYCGCSLHQARKAVFPQGTSK